MLPETKNMITPEQFLKEFEEKFPDWDSFQGNKFKNVRESWIVANFLRTYNMLYNLNYSLPLPAENNPVPDIEGCIDEPNDKSLNFEIGEVLLDGAARAEKYKNLASYPVFKEIELLTGRIVEGYSQIISIFPEVKVYESYKR